MYRHSVMWHDDVMNRASDSRSRVRIPPFTFMLLLSKLFCTYH